MTKILSVTYVIGVAIALLLIDWRMLGSFVVVACLLAPVYQVNTLTRKGEQ